MWGYTNKNVFAMVFFHRSKVRIKIYSLINVFNRNQQCSKVFSELTQSSIFELLPNWLSRMAMSIPWTIVGTAELTGQSREKPTFPDFCTFFMQLLNFSWHFMFTKPEETKLCKQLVHSLSL